jgi:hypothetical protein
MVEDGAVTPDTDPGKVQLTEFDAAVEEKPEPVYPLNPAYLQMLADEDALQSLAVPGVKPIAGGVTPLALASISIAPA